MVLAKPWLHRILCGCLAVALPLSAAIRLQVRDGRPLVDGVYVDGHGPYRFLIDTGTNVNLIETRLAASIGIEPAFRVDLMSSVGKTALGGSDGHQVELGPVRADEQRFLLSPLDTVHSLGSDIRGVLSQAFLSRFDYMLDLRGRQLEFGRQERNGNRSRFTVLDGRAAVATSLGDMVLDSGVTRLVRFGVDPEGGDRHDLRTVTGSQIVGMVSSRLTIEGRNVWRGDAVAIPAQTEPGVAGLMPLSLFRTVYVCNSEGYVVFE
jgi:hypothetical protein